VSVLDRFRKLERARREKANDAPPPSGSLERFRPQLDPAARPEAKSCAKCGAQNRALDSRCANCDAELDGEAMRGHQEEQRANDRAAAERASVERDERRRAAEADLERRRAERREREIDQGIAAADRLAALDWSRPLIALLQSTRWLPNPWLRLGAQLVIAGGFFAALVWTLLDLRRYPLLALLLMLVGVVPRGRRRWWR